MGILYLILKDNLVKVGKSKNENSSRLNQYGKTARIICTANCDNQDSAEKELILLFRNNFRLVKGREWFAFENIYKAKELFLTFTQNLPISKDVLMQDMEDIEMEDVSHL